MDIKEGRKNTANHYFEISLLQPRLNVLAQKSGVVWILYLVWSGKNAPVRTLQKIYHDSGMAKEAIVSIAEALTAYTETER